MEVKLIWSRTRLPLLLHRNRLSLRSFGLRWESFSASGAPTVFLFYFMSALTLLSSSSRRAMYIYISDLLPQATITSYHLQRHVIKVTQKANGIDK